MALLQEQQAAPQKQSGDMQGKYNALMGQLTEFLYDEKTIQMITDAFKSNAPIGDVIPMIVGRIFQGMLEQAMSQGKTPPPDFIILAMAEITEAVVELAVDAGLIGEGDVQQVGRQSFMGAARNLDQNMGAKVPPEQREEYARRFGAIGGMQ